MSLADELQRAAHLEDQSRHCLEQICRQSPDKALDEIESGIVGRAWAIYLEGGPDRLRKSLRTAREMVEYLAAAKLISIKCQVILPGKAEPSTGIAILPANPARRYVERVVKPHLAGVDPRRIMIRQNGKSRDLFVSEMSTSKMPYNKRATDLVRKALISANSKIDPKSIRITGPAILFNERVWF